MTKCNSKRAADSCAKSAAPDATFTPTVLIATFSLKPKTMASTRGNAQLQLPSCLMHHYDLQFPTCQSARPQSQLTDSTLREL